MISGFTQRRGQRHGLHDLFYLLHAEHAGDSTQVELHRWCDPWRQIADDIANCAPGALPETLRVLIYAFSWGAGWGFIQLAKALARHRIQIAAAVLADPVYRSRWLSLSWLSMLAPGELLAPVIRIPENVARVRYFTQRTNRPRAHELVAIDPAATRIYPPLRLHGTPHELMDNAAEFHQVALETARNWGNG